MGLNKPGSREHKAQKAREQGAWKQESRKTISQRALKLLLGSRQKQFWELGAKGLFFKGAGSMGGSI